MPKISSIFAAVCGALLLVGCAGQDSPAVTDNDYVSVPTKSAEIAVSTEPETSAELSTETSTERSTERSTEPSTEEYTDIPEITENFDDWSENTAVEYHFRTQKQLEQHFDKHGGEFGDEFGYATAADYEAGASSVINDPSALYKTEAEDGDGVYYIEETNEFVILSTDGYIRTYFRPSAGKKYFDRQ